MEFPSAKIDVLGLFDMFFIRNAEISIFLVSSMLSNYLTTTETTATIVVRLWFYLRITIAIFLDLTSFFASASIN